MPGWVSRFPSALVGPVLRPGIGMPAEEDRWPAVWLPVNVDRVGGCGPDERVGVVGFGPLGDGRTAAGGTVAPLVKGGTGGLVPAARGETERLGSDGTRIRCTSAAITGWFG